MNSLVLRSLCLLAFSLLAACQSTQQPTEPSHEAFSHELQRFEQSLAAGDLAAAEDQLKRLQESSAGKTELERCQRQLADAYLQLGQSALLSGDMNTAASALNRARDLLPKAPALTSGINQAITRANSIVVVLPELDDEEALNKALDGVAAELTKSNRAVRVEVRDNQQFARLITVLDSRIKPLKPELKVQYSAVVKPALERQRLILLPAQ